MEISLRLYLHQISSLGRHHYSSLNVLVGDFYKSVGAALQAIAFRLHLQLSRGNKHDREALVCGFGH
jgi:hypothetical protein